MHSQATPSFAIFDDYRPTVSIVVAMRWLMLLGWFFILDYRSDHDYTWVTLNLIAVGLAALNTHMTWRIVKRQVIHWRHALALSLIDLIVITAALFLDDGFRNDQFVFYYPALLGLSLLFPGRTSFAVVAVVIALYIAMAFTVSPSLDLDLKQEKVLFGRLITMVGIVVVGTLINGWERTRRREAVAAERQRADENLELQRKAQQAELAAVEERSRIAREIHDGIAQSIYMLSLHLETAADLARQQREDLKERLDGLVSLSKETLLEVRHYIFDLKPYLEGEKGVASMVENQVREFSMVSGVPTILETRGEERQVAVPVATCLYRVTQESLANTFKHAHASEVKVLLEFVPERIELIVEDNGQGFDAMKSNSGHGLHNMSQRAEELGGIFRLHSTPGKGTKVVIRLPC